MVGDYRCFANVGEIARLSTKLIRSSEIERGAITRSPTPDLSYFPLLLTNATYFPSGDHDGTLIVP